MSECYRCRRAEAVSAAPALYRWPPGTTVQRYVVASTLPPSVAAADLERALDAAASAWSSRCGITFGRAAAAAEAQTLVYFAPIDGPWNILGETELPADGTATAHHRMELDAAERWTPQLLADVVLHETGHEIGIGHAPDDVVAVMRAILQPGLALQPWDDAQGVERYGPVPHGPAETLDAPTLSINFSVPEAGTYAVVFDGGPNPGFTVQFTAPIAGPVTVTATPVHVERLA